MLAVGEPGLSSKYGDVALILHCWQAFSSTLSETDRCHRHSDIVAPLNFQLYTLDSMGGTSIWWIQTLVLLLWARVI